MQERGVTLELEPEEEPTTESDVFYNTEMIINRDISTACLDLMQDEMDKEFTICDALAASGVRGLRYLTEIGGVTHAFLNDMNPIAAENIEKNLVLNDIGEDRATVTNQDANRVLTDNYRQLDFVDIDPFGSPAPYLDSAARSLFRESCIGVTATDLAPLFGSYRKVCERRYGSKPMKNGFSHETGLRILIKEVFETLSRYDFAFEPLFCHYERHYYRVFGKVRESKKACNRSLDDIGYLSFCRDCHWRGFSALKDIPQHCPYCAEPVETAGPLWTGKFSDQRFAEKVQAWLGEQEYGEAEAVAATVAAECDITTPYYDTHKLGSALETEAPRKQELIDTLREYGFRATETHFSPQGVRTDAPMEKIGELVE